MGETMDGKDLDDDDTRDQLQGAQKNKAMDCVKVPCKLQMTVFERL